MIQLCSECTPYLGVTHCVNLFSPVFNKTMALLIKPSGWVKQLLNCQYSLLAWIRDLALSYRLVMQSENSALLSVSVCVREAHSSRWPTDCQCPLPSERTYLNKVPFSVTSDSWSSLRRWPCILKPRLATLYADQVLITLWHSLYIYLCVH